MPEGFSLVVGLGNPGLPYRHTRHNVGFDVLDAWAAEEKISFRSERMGPAEVARLSHAGGTATLMKPLTFMNVSGEAVRAWRDWLKVEAEKILVVVDDVALPLGDLRVRTGGSAGGHNGLRSIEAELGTGNYARVRCGVGAPPPGWSLESYVLGKFSPEEREERSRMVERAVEALRCCQEQGIAVAMNRFNGRGPQINQGDE